MLFFAFVPMITVFLVAIIVGSAELALNPDTPVIGICIILGGVALCCFIYGFVGAYVVYYRNRYSPNIGSHGYFPFLSGESDNIINNHV